MQPAHEKLEETFLSITVILACASEGVMDEGNTSVRFLSLDDVYLRSCFSMPLSNREDFQSDVPYTCIRRATSIISEEFHSSGLANGLKSVLL